MKVNIGGYPSRGRNRKINIQIDDSDTWGMDSTLAHIILPMLMHLKETKHGIPADFSHSGSYLEQYCFDFYSDVDDDAFNIGIKQWEDILDKMIWSFYQIGFKDYDSEYMYGNPKYVFKEIKYKDENGKEIDAFESVDLNKENTWFDQAGLMMHNARIQEGLDLFAKYYRSLWD